MDTHEYKLRNIGERERERERERGERERKCHIGMEIYVSERERDVNNMDIYLKKCGEKDIIGGIMDIHFA